MFTHLHLLSRFPSTNIKQHMSNIRIINAKFNGTKLARSAENGGVHSVCTYSLTPPNYSPNLVTGIGSAPVTLLQRSCFDRRSVRRAYRLCLLLRNQILVLAL